MGVPGIGEGPEAVVPVPGLIPRSVLAVVAMAAGRMVSAEALIDAVWDEPPRSARNAVQIAVSHLRGTFGASVIATAPGGYRLGDPLARIDVVEVDSLVAEARRSLVSGERKQAAAAAEAALELARDVPLAGLPTSWAYAARDRLEETVRAARMVRAQALVGLGRAAEAVAELSSMVADAPLDESLSVALMHAFDAAGRQTDGLQEYGRLRTALADELGADPSAEAQAMFARLLDPAAPNASLSTPIVRLPRLLGPTWGRDVEIEEVVGAVAAGHRLLTILGPGGIGKSRVAIDAARLVADSSERAAWFVDLTACASAADIRDALAVAIDPEGLDPEAVLGRGSHLIVLDGVDQVHADAAGAALALIQAGDVVVLATSRAPLGLPDEHRILVGPLALGGEEAPATRLILERAAGWLDPDEQELAAIGRLAESVDGVPLALELVAAALRLRSPGELVGDVDSALAEMAREQTDRWAGAFAAIDWDLDRLGDDGRNALCALTVFSGSFSLAAGAVVVGALGSGESARRVIADLVDASLVQRLALPGEVRLRMLQPVRLAVGERASTDRILPLARRAFVAHFTDRLIDAVGAMDNGSAALADLYRQDGPEVVRALRMAWDEDRPRAAEALGYYFYSWYYLDRDSEIDEWMPRIEEVAAVDDTAGARCAQMLCLWHTLHGRLEETTPYRAAVERHVSSLAPDWQRRWYGAECERLRMLGRFDEALEALDRSPAPRTQRNRDLMAMLRGNVALTAGRFEDAADIFEDALEADEASGSPNIHIVLSAANAALIAGRLAHAEVRIDEAVALAHAGGLEFALMECASHTAWLHELRGEHARALATVVENMRGFVDDDDAPHFAEMLTIAGMALDGLGRRSECQVVATTLDAIMSRVMPGSFDAWVAEQIAALLRKRPPESGRARSYASLTAMLERAVSSLAAEDGVPA